MKQNYYPFENIYSRLVGGEVLSPVTRVQSVRDHLQVLLSTIPGEYWYDRDYGCKLLSTDFNIENEKKEEGDLYKMIKESIEEFESRLNVDSITISPNIETEEKENTLRKKLTLILKDKDQVVLAKLVFYLSPFALP